MLIDILSGSCTVNATTVPSEYHNIVYLFNARFNSTYVVSPLEGLAPHAFIARKKIERIWNIQLSKGSLRGQRYGKLEKDKRGSVALATEPQSGLLNLGFCCCHLLLVLSCQKVVQRRIC